MRGRLQLDPVRLQRAWGVVERLHKTLSPAVRLEEEITWLALSGTANARDRINELLGKAIKAVANESRLGVARWAARAMPQLPDEARKTPAAWALSLSVATRLGDRRLVPGVPFHEAWGVILNESLNNLDDPTALDEMAVLSAGDVPDFETVRSRYETDPRFRVNGTLLSYVDGNMVQVKVA